MGGYFGGTTGADGSNTYEEDECRHGMNPAYCADCQNKTLETETDWTIDYFFNAQYAGHCARCRGAIEEGERIGRLRDDDAYVHTGCGKASRPSGMRRGL